MPEVEEIVEIIGRQNLLNRRQKSPKRSELPKLCSNNAESVQRCGEDATNGVQNSKEEL